MRKKIIILGIILMLFIVSIAIWGQRTKVVGEIKNNKEVYPTPTFEPLVKSYSGKYFDLTYSKDFEVRNDEGVREGEERLELLGGNGDSRHVVVGVKPTMETEISELAAVKMRRLNPEKYSEIKVALLDQEGMSFSINSQQFERVAITIKDGKQVTVAMTANSNDADLESEFENLILGLTWK